MVLKSQDVFVALKIAAAKSPRAPYARLAEELNMSSSEVHASVKRAEMARLIHGPESGNRPNVSALEEFLVHGLKYAFPPGRGELTRGIPTAHAAAPLRGLIAQSRELPPVWPFAEGTDRGFSFEPLYRTAASAALRDPVFYEYLALADALRDGRSRDRRCAEQELHRLLSNENARSES
jgi:DNA-binding Lrp family transcriptional regulator